MADLRVILKYFQVHGPRLCLAGIAILWKSEHSSTFRNVFDSFGNPGGLRYYPWLPDLSKKLARIKIMGAKAHFLFIVACLSF